MPFEFLLITANNGGLYFYILQLADFNFYLPEQQIARYPLPNRADSRLLVLERDSGAVTHSQFTRLPDYLRAGDLLVLNNTRVLRARIFARRISGARVELLFERSLGAAGMLVRLRANRRPPPATELILLDRSGADTEHRAIVSRWNGIHCELQLQSALTAEQLMEQLGHMPIPPYLRRASEALDEERYQTVYASTPGAVAAPTAGLHFEREMLESLSELGVETGFLTLHTGSGTFSPVKCDDLREHRMHAERFSVDEKLCRQLRACQQRGGRIVAVGTTVVRALETIAAHTPLAAFEGSTDLFIYPGFRFRLVDALITNFHLPNSTLLPLVAAFAGRDAVLNAYRTAQSRGYRFYSYGDAMFIHTAVPTSN